MHVAGEAFRALWPHPPRFWMIWYTTLAAGLTYVWSVVGQGARTPAQNSEGRAQRGLAAALGIRDGKDAAALLFLLVFLCLYVAMLLYWQDFSYYDDDDFILYTVSGHNFPPPIWPQNGRFFPFGMMEFNLMRHFTRSASGYVLFPIFEVLLLAFLLLVVNNGLGVAARTGIAVAVFLTPGILLNFGGLIFEERNIIVLLAGLILCVQRFERSKAVGWAMAAMICGQTMLYFKETCFLVLLGFAAGRLVLRCKGAGNSWNKELLWSQESRLDIGLAALALLFLVSYAAVMGLHRNVTYVAVHGYPLAEVIVKYLKLDLLIWLFAGVVAYRTIRILQGRTAPSLIWDPLAAGGVACFLGYLVLGMCAAYYLAVADFIAVVYLARLAILSWDERPSWQTVGVTLFAVITLGQYIVLSAFTIFELKNVIHAKAELASAVKDRVFSGKLPVLYFPFGDRYRIMEFLVYLNYRGVAITRGVFPGGTAIKDVPCVDYRPNIICDSGSPPAAGDLVIVLPDDDVPRVQAAAYRMGLEVPLFYKPTPSIARVLYPFISAPLATDSHNARPDRWMDASMAVWQPPFTRGSGLEKPAFAPTDARRR